MASRILVAVIGIPLLVLILMVFPSIVMTVALSVLCAIAAYELLGATKFVERKSLLIASILMAASVPVWAYLDFGMEYAIGTILVFVVFLFSIAFSSNETVTLGQIGACLFGGIIIPLFLSTLILMADMPHGRFYVLLPFISAFTSDAFALFAGMAFGKHKLAPVLSPHKTIEGSIGGLLGSVVSCLLYGIIVRVSQGVMPVFWVFVLYGLVGSAISQFGDLCFSYIKRQFGIKDYGKVFLAHGGVIDRFDSVIYCAPLTLLLIHILPFFIF